MALTVRKKKKQQKDKGDLSDIRVKFDYRLMREKSQNDLDDMHHAAQLVAYDIYEKLGWNFHLENLMVGFSYAKAKKSYTGTRTLFFSIDWATSGITDNLNRRSCLTSEQGLGVHAYHSWDKMWTRYKNKTLDEIIAIRKNNPLYLE